MQAAGVTRRLAGLVRLGLCAGFAVAAAAAGAAESAERARIAVAANFAEALERLRPGFEQATGHRLELVTGSTGKLYAQISNGAPFDVLLAADQARPERLEREGLAVPGTRFTYAVGRLVLWSPNADVVAGDGAALLRQGAYRRLAMANPDLAPYGLAAREALQTLGIYESLRGRIVLGESVGQAYAMVATGNAELGLVALAQLHGERAVAGSHWLVPQNLHGPIRQDAVLLTRAESNSAARDFLAHLRSEAAAEVLHAFGFDIERGDRVPGARLTFTDARVRMPIPGQDKTVGYFSVTNEGGRPVALVAARAQGVRAIEIHTTLRDGDMVRMRRLNEVVVAPGETVAFEPGGRHLMLFGVTELPAEIDVEFVTDAQETLTVRFRRFALGQ